MLVQEEFLVQTGGQGGLLMLTGAKTVKKEKLKKIIYLLLIGLKIGAKSYLNSEPKNPSISLIKLLSQSGNESEICIVVLPPELSNLVYMPNPSLNDQSISASMTMNNIYC